MSKYTEHIKSLRKQVLDEIRSFIRNNGPDFIDISDEEDSPYVVFWTDTNELLEGQVQKIGCENGSLYLDIYVEGWCSTKRLFEECDFAFDCLIWMDDLLRILTDKLTAGDDQ